MLFCLPVTPSTQLMPLWSPSESSKVEWASKQFDSILILLLTPPHLSFEVWCWVSVLELSNSSYSLNTYLWCKQLYTHTSGWDWKASVLKLKSTEHKLFNTPFAKHLCILPDDEHQTVLLCLKLFCLFFSFFFNIILAIMRLEWEKVGLKLYKSSSDIFLFNEETGNLQSGRI